MTIHDILRQQEQDKPTADNDLDSRILAGLEQLRLEFSDKPDKKTGELAWINRLIELAAAGMIQLGSCPAHHGPSKLDRAAWYAMNPKFREPAVTAIATREIEKIGRYELDSVYVEKQSFHPDDWYLWSVAACQIQEDGAARVWSCWTLNLTTGSMNGGHYGLSGQDLKTVLATKKSVAVCDPKECGRNDEKEA